MNLFKHSGMTPCTENWPTARPVPVQDNKRGHTCIPLLRFEPPIPDK